MAVFDEYAKSWYEADFKVLGDKADADDGSTISEHDHGEMDEDLLEQLRALGYVK